MNNFLLTSEQGKAYLQEEYVNKNRSTYDIAKELNTYPNKVRRALIEHEIDLRDKSTAQKEALKSGRHSHPTEGTKRKQVTKNKISSTVASIWSNLTSNEKSNRQKQAKEFWESIPESKKEFMRREAAKAIRKAAVEGSEVEKYIMLSLILDGYKVDFHKEFLITKEMTHVDIFLPELRTAIEIDGPTHFFPIWGEENLIKTQKADNVKNSLLLEREFVVIRIKHLRKNISEIYKRKLAEEVKKILVEIKKEFPTPDKRLIIVEA